MTKALVINAFLSLQAKHKLIEGCIFHSDRGSQFTSKSFMNILKQYGVRQSFSRVGMPGDNAWSESFFATMKKECVHWSHFESREDARETIFNYIFGFYNTKRIQERLGYIPPKEYCKRWNLVELMEVA
jgi:putative transposase